MDTFLPIILFVVAWFVGLFSGGFFVLQPLIVLFFGIPYTLKLKRLGALIGNGPLPTYIGSLIILTITFVLVTWGMSALLPNQMVGYWIGVALVLIGGLGQCGATPTNVAEYMKNNARHLRKEVLDKLGEK